MWDVPIFWRVNVGCPHFLSPFSGIWRRGRTSCANARASVRSSGLSRGRFRGLPAWPGVLTSGLRDRQLPHLSTRYAVAQRKGGSKPRGRRLNSLLRRGVLLGPGTSDHRRLSARRVVPRTQSAESPSSTSSLRSNAGRSPNCFNSGTTCFANVCRFFIATSAGIPA